MSNIRHREVKSKTYEDKEGNSEVSQTCSNEAMLKTSYRFLMNIKPNTFWLTRIIILRYLAFIYSKFSKFYPFVCDCTCKWSLNQLNYSLFLLSLMPVHL